MKHLAIFAALLAPVAALAEPSPADWSAVTAEAQGQTVYWNAWGGSTTTNDFIAWVGERVFEDYGVTLEHVKLTDTADAVTRVLSERQAGEDTDGAIDMIWINGCELSMRDEGGGFAVWSLRRAAAELGGCRCGGQDGAKLILRCRPRVSRARGRWRRLCLFTIPRIWRMPLGDMAAILDWSTANPGQVYLPAAA